METNHQPYRENPLLRRSYSLIAPIYDLAIERPQLQAVSDRPLLAGGWFRGIVLRKIQT